MTQHRVSSFEHVTSGHAAAIVKYSDCLVQTSTDHVQPSSLVRVSDHLVSWEDDIESDSDADLADSAADLAQQVHLLCVCDVCM